MNNSQHITLTNEQSAFIVHLWNDRANAQNQLDDDCGFILCDSCNFDSDILEYGQHAIELRGSQSATGNPQTFYITKDMVTID